MWLFLGDSSNELSCVGIRLLVGERWSWLPDQRAFCSAHTSYMAYPLAVKAGYTIAALELCMALFKTFETPLLFYHQLDVPASLRFWLAFLVQSSLLAMRYQYPGFLSLLCFGSGVTPVQLVDTINGTGRGVNGWVGVVLGCLGGRVLHGLFLGLLGWVALFDYSCVTLELSYC